MTPSTTPLIKVVGISGSGKSTLVQRLRGLGYDARPVSQEHSELPDLWQHFEKPFALIYLSASVEAQRVRRPQGTWTRAGFMTEYNRLAASRAAADVRIDTSNLMPEQVCEIAVTLLGEIGVRPSDEPLEPILTTGSATRYTQR